MRDGIFISYAHADGDWFVELQQALAPLQDVRFAVWDDTRIAPASRWHEEIEEALVTARAAVLLLSPAFFASNYISQYELPPLLEAARSNSVLLFPVILEKCGHSAVTGTFQAVHDTAKPLATLSPAERQQVWQRLTEALRQVSASIGDETRIGAESVRLERDLAAVPSVMHVDDKIARASKDPIFDENEKMRENTLVFLKGQRCQAAVTWLLEEIKRAGIDPFRSKAIVRKMEAIAKEENQLQQRATELTREFAEATLAMLNAAKAGRE